MGEEPWRGLAEHQRGRKGLCGTPKDSPQIQQLVVSGEGCVGSVPKAFQKRIRRNPDEGSHKPLVHSILVYNRGLYTLPRPS